MRFPKIVILLFITSFIVAACGAEAIPAAPPAAPGAVAAPSDATAKSADEPSAPLAAPTDAAVDSEHEEAAAAVAEEEPTAVAPVDVSAWQQIALTDARTGELFTLADFSGKTVFVEPFATWCSNCRRQLANVEQARTQLGDDVIFVALSVEPNIDNDLLARYAEAEGFSFVFAAMPPEMLQELAALFGQTVSNPPATPHFIVRADGTVTDLVTGIESADKIVAHIQAAQG